MARVIWFLALFSAMVSSAAPRPRQGCVVGTNMPPTWTFVDNGNTYPYAWPKDYQIEYVQYDQTYCPGVPWSCYTAATTDSFGTAISYAIDHWSSLGNNGITFDFYSNSEPPQQTDPWIPWIKFIAFNDMCQINPDCEHDGRADVFPVDYGGSISYRAADATMVFYRYVDDAYKNQLAAHELGHSMGLNDCTTCNTGTTVLYYETGPSRASTPTTCDIQQMNTWF